MPTKSIIGPMMDALIHSILSNTKDITMLVELLSFLLVLLFVLLLHLYARCFLTQPPATSDRESSAPAAVVPIVLGARLYRLHNFFNARGIDIDNDHHSLSHASKGLEPSALSSIPQFVFKAEEYQGQHELVCIICLSLFKDTEVGKRLALCSHAFHVECIDMWLHSHTTCPICRAPAASDHSDGNNTAMDLSISDHEIFARNDENYGESSGARQSVQRYSSSLEVIVEMPDENNEPRDDTFQRMNHKPLDFCP